MSRVGWEHGICRACVCILGTRRRGRRTTAQPGTGPEPEPEPEPEPGTGQSRTRVRDPVLVHMGSNYRPITARNRLWVASQKWQTSVSAVSIPDRVPNQKPQAPCTLQPAGMHEVKWWKRLSAVGIHHPERPPYPTRRVGYIALWARSLAEQCYSCKQIDRPCFRSRDYDLHHCWSCRVSVVGVLGSVHDATMLCRPDGTEGRQTCSDGWTLFFPRLISRLG